MSKLLAAILMPVVVVPTAVIGIAAAGVGSNASACTTGVSGSQTSTSATTKQLTNSPTDDGQSALNAPIKLVSTTKGAVNSQQAVSMHTGSNLEDPAASPTVNGNGGIAWYQIQDPGNPAGPNPGISLNDAEDPLRSTLYMAPRYEQALKTVNKSFAARWATLDGAEHNAEMVAYLAEHPGEDYYVNRAKDVGPAFQLALKQLAASGTPTDFASSGSAISATLADTSSQGGCTTPGGGTTIVVPPDVSNATEREAVLTAAHRVVDQGVMYAWAGGDANGPTYGLPPDVGVLGYDCSGLVLYALAQARVHIPGMIHSSSNQYDLTKEFTTATSTTDLSRVQPGDLVFFVGDDGTFSAPGHVGIYIGNGQMINAPQSGERVQVADIVHRTDFVAATDPYRSATALKGA